MRPASAPGPAGRPPWRRRGRGSRTPAPRTPQGSHARGGPSEGAGCFRAERARPAAPALPARACPERLASLLGRPRPPKKQHSTRRRLSPSALTPSRPTPGDTAFPGPELVIPMVTLTGHCPFLPPNTPCLWVLAAITGDHRPPGRSGSPVRPGALALCSHACRRVQDFGPQKQPWDPPELGRTGQGLGDRPSPKGPFPHWDGAPDFRPVAG